MTDRPLNSDAALRADLEAWFQGEVRQAAADLRRASLRPARARVVPARGVPGSAIAGLLVVILVLAGISRLPAFSGPAAEPTGEGASPTASPMESSATPPEPTESSPSTSAPPVSIGDRFDDGIPATIDGERVVRTGSLEQLGPGDDRSFLLGGWVFDFRDITPSCALRIDPVAFGPRCMSPYLSDLPTRIPSVFIERWPYLIGGGPVVLRVHRHDAEAATCTPARRQACELTAVVEDVLWNGDDVTAAAPFSAIAAFDRLKGADPNFGTAALTPVPHLPDGHTSPQPSPRLGGLGGLLQPCGPPFPQLGWIIVGSGVSYVLVFPTSAARDREDENFLASGWRGRSPDGLTLCQTITDAAFNHEWIAVENVLVAVQVDVDGATPEQAKLVSDVRESLESPPVVAR